MQPRGSVREVVRVVPLASGSAREESIRLNTRRRRRGGVQNVAYTVIHTYMDWTLHEKTQPASSSDCKLSRRTVFGTSFAGKKHGCLGEKVTQSNLELCLRHLVAYSFNKETGKTTQTPPHSIFLAYQPPPREASARLQASAEAGAGRATAGAEPRGR